MSDQQKFLAGILEFDSLSPLWYTAATLKWVFP